MLESYNKSIPMGVYKLVKLKKTWWSSMSKSSKRVGARLTTSKIFPESLESLQRTSNTPRGSLKTPGIYLCFVPRLPALTLSALSSYSDNEARQPNFYNFWQVYPLKIFILIVLRNTFYLAPRVWGWQLLGTYSALAPIYLFSILMKTKS